MRALPALEDLEPLFKFFMHLSVRKSRENYRQIYGKPKASFWRNLSTDRPPQFFRTILCFVAIVYNCFFFSEQPFYENYSTLDSHANTAISHTFAYRQDGLENRDKVYYYHGRKIMHSRSTYISTLSQEFHFWKRISRVLDLHTG